MWLGKKRPGSATSKKITYVASTSPTSRYTQSTQPY